MVTFPAFIFSQTPLLEVYEVQGSGNISPFQGQVVNLDTAVVTYANSSIAYVQAAVGDGNPATSDGLLVRDGNVLQLVPGDRVLVSGRVEERQGQTILASASINKIGSGPALPPTLFEPGTQNIGGVSPQERYEGMLLQFDITAATGSNNFNSILAYVGDDRPFREPGVLAPGLPDLPVFDGNPELFNYDPNGLGQSNFIFYNAGDQLSGIGIMEQFSFGYELSPIAAVELDAVAPTSPVRSRTNTELSVGSLNALFFLDSESDYQLRLTKVVNYISESMNYPDVIALQEIGGQSEIEDLIFRLRQKDAVLGDYAGFGLSSNGFLNVGYLVHKRINNPEFTTLGTGDFFSGGGLLHNRFPLLLEFEVPGGEGIRLQVLNIHMRSLNDIDTDMSVRQRRHEQAVSVANMVEELRNDNLVVVGDYNAYQFTDGYVDVYNQISGLPSLGAQIPVTPIVSPPLEAGADMLSDEERYSFIFRGSAQQLDHCLYNQLTGLTPNGFAFARGNADASVNYESNANSLSRASDHDGFVFYLGIDALSSNSNPALNKQVDLQFASPGVAGQTIRYKHLPQGSSIDLYNAMGQLTVSLLESYVSGEDGQIALPVNLRSGTYFLRVRKGNQLLIVRKLIIQ